MTSYEFEVAAKNAVIDTCREQFGEDYDITGIQFVWFAHIMGYKKAILIDRGENQRMYEVTLDITKSRLYVDTYRKLSNVVVNWGDIDTKVRD